MIKLGVQLLSYLLSALIPYWMITGSAAPYLYFPLFAVPVVFLFYFSGPLPSAGIAAIATLVGTGGFIFSAGDFGSGTPVIFVAQTAWLWVLFWITGRLIEMGDLDIHRLEEEAEKLEVKSAGYEQEGRKIKELCASVETQIARYTQLRSFTEELGSSIQVRDIETKVDFFLKKFFGQEMDLEVTINYFPSPNSPDLNDGVGEWITRNRIPLLVTDLSEDQRFALPGVERSGSLMACPVERENLVVGTLNLESTRAQRWREQDLRFFADMSSIVSLAISNAVYYEKVESLAVKDSLTQLFVRMRFDERIEEEFARSRAGGSPLSLLMLDIDGFKKINDHYGHGAGDQVLKIVAETVMRLTRETDFCARYGGEEISVLMPLTTVENALQIAERIRESIQETLMGPQRISVTISGGLSAVQSWMKGPHHLVESADRALYKAKEGGRNRINIDR